jgi:tRNA 5-methylaminomethyl-2-thiouridine biosynthesis bifunctional protein
MSQLTYAKVQFTAQGTPFSETFADVYFSDAGGLAETDYVFLQQNRLPQRWQTHATEAFHIVETGFGTGANFLLTWLRFNQFKRQYPQAHCQRLYFSSVEKYPLTLADLQQALQVHTELHSELQPLVQQLLQQYPVAISGCHRLVFDQGIIILDLWLGDVSEVLPHLAAADAIYLDGFAPSKNPDMWQPELFTDLAAISHANTSIATFTAAGVVKRGLQQAGFNITKVKGFGRKRDMLTATLASGDLPCSSLSNKAPTDSTLPSTAQASPCQQVTIIGGGIASLCAALALQQRNIAVHLICADADVAMQASQNRQGAIYPNLHAEMTANSQLQVQTFLYARQFYQRWQKQGLDFKLDFCGLLHLGTTPQLQQRQAKIVTLWPEQLVRAVDATQGSELAGLTLQQPGIYYPLAGWLSPKQFCQAALDYLQQQPQFRFSNNTQVQDIKRHNKVWLISAQEASFNSDYVVIAAGSELSKFKATSALPLATTRGQVSHVSQPKMAALKTVLCHKGYITPAWQGLHSIGATFDRDASSAFISADDDTENIQQVVEQLESPAWLEGAKVPSATAAFRASFPGQWPIATEIEPTLFALGGFAARGIMYAPLLAELIACQICSEPLPLTKQKHYNLSSARYKGNK